MITRTTLSVIAIFLPCLALTAQNSYSATFTLAETAHETPVTELLYGQFIEHLGRCVAGGLYEEDSPLSDERGFRNDVLKLVKDLDVPLLRFPGGTVTKIYHWKDGIGPKDQRRKRPNLIWGGNIEYRFGTAEFIEYCREVGTEVDPMIGPGGEISLPPPSLTIWHLGRLGFHQDLGAGAGAKRVDKRAMISRPHEFTKGQDY